MPARTARTTIDSLFDDTTNIVQDLQNLYTNNKNKTMPISKAPSSKKQPLLSAEEIEGPSHSNGSGSNGLSNNAVARRKKRFKNIVSEPSYLETPPPTPPPRIAIPSPMAISIGNTEEEAEAQQQQEEGIREKKQGHKLFFCCCDTKRATIMFNTVILLLNLFTFTKAIIIYRGDYYSEDVDLKALVIKGCGMFVTFATIIGAFWYSKSIVLVGLVFTCYQLTIATLQLAKYSWDGVGNNGVGKLEVILPAVWYSLLFYAESMFIIELNDGIITKENYKRRERSGCCRC